MSQQEKIYVTKTFLPPKAEYEAYLDKIWASVQLTNQGPLLKELEQNLEEYLKVNNFHFVTNGTLALQIAIKALDINNAEVITTPFSYVATTSSILWENCKPIFVDIESDTFCIDANKIEAAITPETKAIMAVHVFGNPCNIEKIQTIAKRYNLKVIYDAAHAFGVTYKGKSLLGYGDISTCSFHATKLYHTIEGGAVIASSPELNRKIELTKRFGHEGDDHYMLGINAKASEFQAAMGLCNLKYVDSVIEERKRISNLYDLKLASKYQGLKVRDDTDYNYAYYPILFDNEAELIKTVTKLNKQNIFPRRYFYPSLNELSYLSVSTACPISEDISKRIICLPLYTGLEEAKVELICEVILK